MLLFITFLEKGQMSGKRSKSKAVPFCIIACGERIKDSFGSKLCQSASEGIANKGGDLNKSKGLMLGTSEAHGQIKHGHCIKL